MVSMKWSVRTNFLSPGYEPVAVECDVKRECGLESERI